MKIPIIKIGNSKGIRLSKTIIEKYDIKDEVEMVLKEESIELKVLPVPRSTLDAAFEKAPEDDDKLLPDVFAD